MQLKYQITIAILMIIIVIFCGTISYMVVEKWNFLDAFYMTIITITTVGFGEVRPLSNPGRWLTIIISIIGFAVVMINAAIIVALFMESKLEKFILGGKKMLKKINNLNDHFILCGSGPLSDIVIAEFYRLRRPFVLLCSSREVISRIVGKYHNILYLIGDPTDEDLLQKARIEKARGLIALMSSDSQNLLLILTARGMNNLLKIATAVEHPENIKKFQKAGADNVISGIQTTGIRLVSMMLRPHVVSFLDVITTSSKDDVELRLEEIGVPAKSSLCGLTLMEAKIPQKTGLIVIAIKKHKTGEFIYNPTFSNKLEENDTMIVMGKVEQIKKLEELI